MNLENNKTFVQYRLALNFARKKMNQSDKYFAQSNLITYYTLRNINK